LTVLFVLLFDLNEPKWDKVADGKKWDEILAERLWLKCELFTGCCCYEKDLGFVELRIAALLKNGTDIVCECF